MAVYKTAAGSQSGSGGLSRDRCPQIWDTHPEPRSPDQHPSCSRDRQMTKIPFRRDDYHYSRPLCRRTESEMRYLIRRLRERTQQSCLDTPWLKYQTRNGREYQSLGIDGLTGVPQASPVASKSVLSGPVIVTARRSPYEREVRSYSGATPTMIRMSPSDVSGTRSHPSSSIGDPYAPRVGLVPEGYGRPRLRGRGTD